MCCCAFEHSLDLPPRFRHLLALSLPFLPTDVPAAEAFEQVPSSLEEEFATGPSWYGRGRMFHSLSNAKPIHREPYCRANRRPRGGRVGQCFEGREAHGHSTSLRPPHRSDEQVSSFDRDRDHGLCVSRSTGSMQVCFKLCVAGQGWLVRRAYRRLWIMACNVDQTLDLYVLTCGDTNNEAVGFDNSRSSDLLLFS